MKKVKLILCLSLLLITGCFKRDNLEDITIYSTSYPIEYIVDNLYGEHSIIKSIYPNGVDINNYSLTEKQIRDYSKANMYIFNGLTKEKDYVIDMVNNNHNLMIIDASSTIEYSNSVEEIWLDPSNFLMMALNIKNGLNDYITNHYLKNSIEENYENLKIKISNLDAKLKLLYENATTTTIITDTNTLTFLEKYGFNIISLDSNTVTDKMISDAINHLNKMSNKYILTLDANNSSDVVNRVVDKTKAELLTIHKLSNLTDKEKANKEDYITLFNQNIEQLKKALY
ncbi:MAG: metal ABC transporter substrate-binding protein [Tenericutes bacterium]|nr:metal ABC transporter substrate-binding protein [Mycoplasmatota bacterium]